MDSASTCRTKQLEKDTYRRYTKSHNLSCLNHHLIKSNKIHFVDKLTTKKLYLISIKHETTTSTSQEYLESVFRNLPHIFTRLTTIDSKLQCFQYKILHNTLYFN